MWSLYFYLYSSKDNDDFEVDKVISRLLSSWNKSSGLCLYLLIQYRLSVQLRIIREGGCEEVMIIPFRKPSYLLKELLNLGNNEGNRALFFSGHCSNYYLQVTDNSIFTIYQIEKVLCDYQPFNLIVFDCCSMGTFEVLYHLGNHTEYILSCQDYMGWYGFIGHNFPNIFQETDSRKIGFLLIEDYLNHENYPTDATLLSTSHNHLLYRLLHAYPLTYYPEAEVHDQWYDIVHLVNLSNYSQEIKNMYFSLLHQIILFYASNHRGWNGLSIGEHFYRGE